MQSERQRHIETETQKHRKRQRDREADVLTRLVSISSETERQMTK